MFHGSCHFSFSFFNPFPPAGQPTPNAGPSSRHCAQPHSSVCSPQRIFESSRTTPSFGRSPCGQMWIPMSADLIWSRWRATFNSAPSLLVFSPISFAQAVTFHKCPLWSPKHCFSSWRRVMQRRHLRGPPRLRRVPVCTLRFRSLHFKTNGLIVFVRPA